MTRLISVELRRLVSRRLFKALTMLALVAFAAIGTIVFVASDDSPERVAAAEVQRREDVAECISNIERGVADYPDIAPSDAPQFCRDETYGSDPRFPYEDVTWILGSVGVPFMMLGWLLGASFLGAEWKDRTITTTLTWERRRIRVLAAKALALSLVAFVWVVALQALFALALLPAGAFEGNMAGVDAAWWTDTTLLMLRSGGIAALAGVFGLSLAAIGRNTAAALGVGFVYLAVIEGMIRGFKPSWVDWLIGDNAALLLIGGDEVTQVGHSQVAAGLLLAAYAAAIFTLALAIFRRRDIA